MPENSVQTLLDQDYRIPDLAKRQKDLRTLESTLRRFESELTSALATDLGKSPEESFLSEIALVYKELNYFKKNLSKLMSTKAVKTPLALFYSKGLVRRVPYGNVLILSPWNYPVNLSLLPLIGAIAGGNRVVLKPSEFSPETSRTLQKLIKEAFPQDQVTCVLGDAQTSENLTNLKWDYIFFTGSTDIGRKIMKAASQHLTPLTLELGGKSPCIADDSIEEDTFVRRLWFGKTINCGQTCIAPDYLVLPQSLRDVFLKRSRDILDEMFGKDIEASRDYARIINKSHFQRLEGLIDGCKVLLGGKKNKEKLFFEPTVVEAEMDSPIMNEEIFGPILPVFSYDEVREIHKILDKNPNPLAFYIFSKKKEFLSEFMEKHRFGGAAINETLTHIVPSTLPFGGVGESGFGQYHGYASFETFTRPQSTLRKSFWPDFKIRYSPFSRSDLRILKGLLD